MRSYRQDPRWITARFASKCAGCDSVIRTGETIFYYPRSRTAYGSTCECGQQRAAEFTAATAYEEG